MNLKSTLLFLLGTAASGWAGAVFHIDPTSSVLQVGDIFNADVVIDTTQPVAAFSFDLTFPTFLQILANPQDPGFFGQFGLFLTSAGTIDNVGGALSGNGNVVADFDPATAVFDTGHDVLLRIPFTVVAAGAGQLQLQNISVSDPDINDIGIDFVLNSDVVANQATPTPEPATWGLAGIGTAVFIASRARRVLRSS